MGILDRLTTHIKHETAPIRIQKVDDLSLVLELRFGHNKLFSELTREEQRNIRHSVASCDLLAVEGNRWAINALNVPSIESAVVRTFEAQQGAKAKGKPKRAEFLEEGADYGVMLSKFGQTPTETLCLQLAPMAETEMVREMPMGFVAALRRAHSSLSPNKVAHVGRSLSDQEQWPQYDLTKGNLHAIGELAIRHRGRVRDFTLIHPRLRKLRSAYRGMLGVMVGSGHVPAVTEALTDRAMIKPLDWQEDVMLKKPAIVPVVDSVKRLAHDIDESYKSR